MGVFSFVLLVSLATPNPSPLPTAPKEITRTKSSPFCTALHEAVAPSVLGVLIDDRIIIRGALALSKFGKDSALDPHGASVTMDAMYLGRLSESLANNIGILDGALSNGNLFPGNLTGDIGQRLQTIHSVLTQIVATEKQSLNAINGTVDTRALSDLQGAGTDGQALITRPSLASDRRFRGFGTSSVASRSTDGNALMVGPPPMPGEPSSITPALLPMAVGPNMYAPSIRSIVSAEQAVAAPEDLLAKEIQDSAATCK